MENLILQLYCKIVDILAHSTCSFTSVLLECLSVIEYAAREKTMTYQKTFAENAC